MKQRSRIMAFILAIVVTLGLAVGALALDDYYGGDGVFADMGIMPMVAVSGYTVDAIAFTGTIGSTAVFSSSTLNAGQYSVYWPNGSFSGGYGYRVTIPASTVPGTLFVRGFYPASVPRVAATTAGWHTYTQATIPAAGAFFGAPSFVLDESTVIPPPATSTNNSLSSFPSFDGSVYIPSHTQTLYLYVFYNSSSNEQGGAWRSSSSSITFEPDPSASTGSTLSQILAAINNVNTSTQGTTQAVNGTTQAVNNLLQDQQNAPMRKFEDGYFEKFQDQLSQTESALSPSNPALPNGGDIAGFTNDLSDGLGLSGSAFDAQEFGEATSVFSGSESTGAGGPWEFFTQSVADDLSGDSPAGIDLDELDPILQWFEQAERRGFSWSSRS